MFQLHTTLKNDSILLSSLPLCQVLLINNETYPWLILVPQRTNTTEVCELSIKDQIQLTLESHLIATMMRRIYNPDKLNIATIGNIVPQLHVHLVARFKKDPLWPAPIWGNNLGPAHNEETTKKEVSRLREEINNCKTELGKMQRSLNL